jgi:hypothetical protein
LQLCVVVEEPAHCWPPFAGAGLVHVRVPVRVPVPHDPWHDEKLHADHPPLTGTGHAWSEHWSVIVDEPAQSWPPFAGAGLVHVRVAVRVPSPHVTEQGPTVQDDQPPAMGGATNAAAVVFEHGPSVQSTIVVDDPVQSLPPPDGAGLSHWRVAFFVQVRASHAPYE